MLLNKGKRAWSSKRQIVENILALRAILSLNKKESPGSSKLYDLIGVLHAVSGIQTMEGVQTLAADL